jgi:hypothetical protein
MPRRAPDHAHDAGGDPRILADKAQLRNEIWSQLEAARRAPAGDIAALGVIDQRRIEARPTRRDR